MSDLENEIQLSVISHFGRLNDRCSLSLSKGIGYLETEAREKVSSVFKIHYFFSVIDYFLSKIHNFFSVVDTPKWKLVTPFSVVDTPISVVHTEK